MKSHITLPRLCACTFGQSIGIVLVQLSNFLYGNELRWVAEYKSLGCYLTRDFVDNRDLKRQARAIYSRGNMIVRKFSTCSVDVKNQLVRS